MREYVVTLRGLCVTYRRVLDGWLDLLTPSYIHKSRNYRQYSTIAIWHTFQFTVTHALAFSVFTSRIMETDLQQPHSNFKSHMKSSLHRLTPFLSCLQLPTQFNSKLISWQAGVSNSTLFSTLLLRLLFCSAEHFLINHFARTPQKTQPLLLRCVYWSVA
jgi:hypothetical protein